jgi:lysophospholipase L1-like esterase
MRRILAIAALLLGSCTPRFQQILLPPGEPANVLVPHQDKFDRFAPAIDCFFQDDTLRNSQAARIVFTGSSSIAMWQSLEADMPGLPVLNRGFGGSTLAEVNYYFDQLITPHCPEVVVLYCGENDIVEGHSPRQVYNDFVTFAQLLQWKAPQARLIYIGMKPSPARWHQWPQFQRANSLIRHFLTQHHPEKWQYLDLTPTLLDPVTRQPDPCLFREDMLHLNADGYQRWTEAVRPVVREAYPAIGA